MFSPEFSPLTRGMGNLSGYAQVSFADGSSGVPSIAFASEPTLGFWRSASGAIRAQGTFNTLGMITSGASVQIPNGFGFYWASRAVLASSADGNVSVQNNAQTIGSQFKVDALPTIASGGGSGPAAAVTAGSTPLAGSLTVGGTPGATNIVVNFNGTAFPSAPTIVWQNSTTSTAVKATTSTTQITFTSTAFAASDVLSWICISSK